MPEVYRDLWEFQLGGDLRIAITDYFRPCALPNTLRHERDQFPRLRLHASIRKIALIEEEAASGEFDIDLSMSILVTGAKRQKLIQLPCLLQEQLVRVSRKSFKKPSDGILPLVVMPNSCALHRYAVRCLEQSRIRYLIMYSASGISGSQLAIAADPGVTCFNSSAISDEIEPFVADTTLPTLPKMAFTLLPARLGET